jgi:hypothetical protein
MSTDRPKRGSMSLEKATVSNMWEIAAIVELLEQKGLCTKQDLHTIIDELRGKNPRARIPETAFPEPYLLTETENMIIDDILELLNKHGRPHTSRKACWSDWGRPLRWDNG